MPRRVAGAGEMKAGGIATWIFLALLAAIALHAAHYYPLLPERVASHFGPGGRPDGWSSKAALFWIYAAMVGMMAVISFGGAAAISRLPRAMINLPNKDYWLAPERREASLAVIARYLLWLGVATLLLLALIMDGVFRANLEPGGRLGDVFLFILVVYTVLVVASTGWLVVRFGRAPRS